MTQPIAFRETGASAKEFLQLFFSEEVVKNEKASEDGPPIFDVVHQVRVVVAGDRSNEGPIYTLWRKKHDGSEKVDDQKAYNRFKRPYEDWKTGQAPAQSGTPLEQWPLMDKAMVATLKASHVYTVQELGSLSDEKCEAVLRRGGREWREKARVYLEEAKEAASEAKLRGELAKRDAQIEELQDQVRTLLQKQNNITPGFDPPKRKKGKDDIKVVEPEVEEARL
jgi:hypothetical protein